MIEYIQNYTLTGHYPISDENENLQNGMQFENLPDYREHQIDCNFIDFGFKLEFRLFS